MLVCFPFHCNPFVITDVQTKILPGVTHWQSPDYFAYFPSNSSVAGFLGEMLSGGINMVGFSWITSPAATELEMIVLDWLANLLKLPSDFLSKGESFNCYFTPFIILIRLLNDTYVPRRDLPKTNHLLIILVVR